ncbi:MAG: hypothetical protein KAH30_02710 [Caldisericia bacterium]|nr:hypothetical protein [Caldisericia bacterium]
MKLSGHEENMLKYFPGWVFIHISEDIEDTLVSWATNGDNPAEFDLYFLRIGIDEKPVILENKNSGYPHYPLSITDDYILSNSWDSNKKKNTLWLTDISKMDTKEFNCIKLDSFYGNGYYANTFKPRIGSYNFQGDYVFWQRDDGDGWNICWAKISDIFPDKNNVAGMEE